MQNLKNFSSKLLYISYRRVQKPRSSVSGYRKSDMEVVARRYLNSSRGMSEKKLLITGAFRDLNHFLNVDCRGFFKKNNQWNILDVGCGSGVHSKIFKGKSFPHGKVNYEGCEIDDSIIQVCKKINPGINFFKSFAHSIDAPDNKYNFLFSSSVLHYTLEKWQKSLREFARVSRKYILLSRVPFSKFYPTFYVEQNVLGLQGREKHYFVVLNRDEFENYISKLGLKILARDYSSEEYPVEGVSEKIMLMEYLLSK